MNSIVDFVLCPLNKIPTTRPYSAVRNLRKKPHSPSTIKPYKNGQFVEQLLANLNRNRQNNVLCDVEIIVDGQKRCAHKAVLASSSAYFQAMFTGNLIEQHQNTIELHALSIQMLDLLLDFIYTGIVNIDQDNVQDLAEAADMLGLQDVVTGCTEFLINELHPVNAVGIFCLAQQHNWRKLSTLSLSYIENNFLRIIDEDELYTVDIATFLQLISSEHLRIDAEVQIFTTAMRWIHTNQSAVRSSDIYDILTCGVRLTLVPHQLIEGALNDATCWARNQVRTIIQQISGGTVVSNSAQARLGAKKDIYVIGGSKRELNTVWERGLDTEFVGNQRYDAQAKCWAPVPNMKVHRLVPGVAVLNGQIYVAGGEEYSTVLGSCECFDPMTKQWRTVPNMVVARCDFGLCAVDGRLYAMGGWMGGSIGKHITDSMETYDPMTNCWEIIGALPEPRFSMGVIAHKGFIYMVGGCSIQERHLDDCLCYNPNSGKWTTLAPMDTARFEMGVAVFNDSLYVVGGTYREQILNTVERYSFITNTWSYVRPMLTPRSGAAVVALNGLLYVIGGVQTQSTPFYRAQCTMASVECYNPKTGKWTYCAPLNESRAEGRAVVL